MKYKTIKFTSLALAACLFFTGCFSNEPTGPDFERAFIEKMESRSKAKTKEFLDRVNMKTVIHAQESTGTTVEPSYSSRITIEITPSVDLYKLVEVNSDNKAVVRKIDSSKMFMSLSGISSSKLVNESWVADLSKLKNTKADMADGWPISHWVEPVIID